MSDYRISQHGRDSSGRPIFMTAYMASWWAQVVDDLGWTPVIVQGAFMAKAGGGASASAGYHDLGGCLDLRVRDLSGARREQLVRTLRRHGAAAWIRDQAHGGFDPHLHLVLGTDHPLTAGATQQWRAYRDGRDGLASNGPDYHWRPNPLVLAPPEEDMPLNDADKKWLTETIRTEAQAAVDKVLDVDINAHDPEGSPAFRGKNLREIIKAIAKKTGAV